MNLKCRLSGHVDAMGYRVLPVPGSRCNRCGQTWDVGIPRNARQTYVAQKEQREAGDQRRAREKWLNGDEIPL